MRDANPSLIEEQISRKPVRIVEDAGNTPSEIPTWDRPSQDPSISESRDYQNTIAQHGRTSFNFATRFLPADKRESTVVLYAFFRMLDDLVDERPAEMDPQVVRDEIEGWQAWLQDPDGVRAPATGLASDVRRAIERNEIPTRPIAHFLDGLRADLDGQEIHDEQDLERYCYQVASTVGIAMSHTLGAVGEEAVAAAARLGAAMQLTNILRDVGEDLEAGRVFIPTTVLADHGLSHSCLRLMMESTGPNAAFREMMAGQIDLARSWYREGLAGIWLLPDDCRLPILVASRIYRRLLTNIENNDYDTLRQRVKASTFDKLRETVFSYSLVRLWSRDE